MLELKFISFSSGINQKSPPASGYSNLLTPDWLAPIQRLTLENPTYIVRHMKILNLLLVKWKSNNCIMGYYDNYCLNIEICVIRYTKKQGGGGGGGGVC